MALRPPGFAPHWLRPLVGSRVPERFILADAHYLECPADDDPRTVQLQLHTAGFLLLIRQGDTWIEQHPIYRAGVPEALETLWELCSASRCTWIVAYRLSRLLECLDWWREIDRGHLAPMGPDDHCDRRQAYDIPVGGNGGRIGTMDHIGNCPCAATYRSCPLDPMVTGDPPTILGCVWRGRRVTLVDSRNYWPDTPEQIVLDQLHVEPLVTQGAAASVTVQLALSERLQALAKLWMATIDCWRTTFRATWQPTAAGLAWSCYRRTYLAGRSILVHDSETALQLERLSYYGGEVYCGYVGQVMDHHRSEPPPPRSLQLQLHTTPGGVAETDCSALYPYCLGTYPVPTVHRADHWRDYRLQTLTGQNRSWGVAHVRVSTNAPSYPCRTDYHTGQPLVGPSDALPADLLRRPHRTIYPVGTFDTILCGCDLVDALRLGHITRVYRWSEYTTATIGRVWLNVLWQTRMALMAQQRSQEERLVKLLMNSLIGKFGATRQQWQDFPNEEWPRAWDTWLRVSAETGEVQQCRTIAGLVQRQTARGETESSCPAIAAAITALGRRLMRQRRALLPPHSVYYQDTDSLWVRPEVVSLLIGQSTPEPPWPGVMRLIEVHHSATFLGQRCYWTPAGWTVAGLRRGDNDGPDDEWIAEVCDGAGTILHRGPGKGVRLRRSRRRPRVVETGRAIGPDGWTTPLEVSPLR